MSAFRAGLAAYNARELVPRPEFGWDTYAGRLNRYGIYAAYHDSTVYSSVESFAASLKAANRLYKNTRNIYNPIARQNRIITSNVYQGAIDVEHLADGALPFTGNEAMLEPVRQLIQWSNLGQQLSQYVHYAALFGDVGLWIVDDRVRQRVRLEVLHPSKIREVEIDEVGNVRSALIEYERDEPPDVVNAAPGRFGFTLPFRTNTTYTYTLKVTREKFETFKNGEPFGFYRDFDGELISSWDNDYGFVPLKLAHYEEGEGAWGKNAFYNCLTKIDSINDAASLLIDQIRKIVIPLLKAKGLAQSDIAFSGERDEMLIMYLSKADTDVEAITTQIDIAAAQGSIAAMLDELNRDMPELALQTIREQGGQLTAPGVRTGYSDAIGRITDTRKNLDPALVAALQMAVTIGGIRGYDGFGGFNAQSFDNGEMELSLKEREVLPDSLSKSERLTQLATIADKPVAYQKLMLRELNYSDDEIAEVIGATEAEQATKSGKAITDSDLEAALKSMADLMPIEDASLDNIPTLPSAAPSSVIPPA